MDRGYWVAAGSPMGGLAEEPTIPVSRLTLRLRLTLWYSAVVAGIILAFGLAVYTILSFILINEVNSNLKTTAEYISDRSLAYVATGFDPLLHVPELDQFGSSRTYVQVWDVDGRTLLAHNGYDDPLDPGALAGQRTPRDVYADNVHLWVLTERLVTNDADR